MIFFHNPDEENGIYSNWYPSVFSLEGVEYTSMEQYMLYKKALLFQDQETAHQILTTSNVARIKALGRSVRDYNDTVWAGLRQLVVYKGLLAKFEQNVHLHRALLSTRNQILAECAVNDTIWGIGLSMKDDRRFDMAQWRGQNLLGFTLMEVRNSLRQGWENA